MELRYQSVELLLLLLEYVEPDGVTVHVLFVVSEFGHRFLAPLLRAGRFYLLCGLAAAESNQVDKEVVECLALAR